ncbi:uncharacterized protein LOC114264944 isoform X2 [Camellia sinensis]|uniref:uncharacterized protein LOC114264944 isoform X2 n=1 Tax=Camellia sinensis TaxID=4442 RepID=UPI00103589E4|nr:uncharacterized protein LOC114264944 isoform X2 [Camellia sinensis]
MYYYTVSLQLLLFQTEGPTEMEKNVRLKICHRMQNLILILKAPVQETWTVIRIRRAFGGDDSDVGSPRINLTATAKSNPPVDSQSLRESDIQLNMFLLDFILLFYFF